ncbi:peptidase family M49-domain-containing protein [Fimicolochytrium jonesii]|uniref:peptidase family M49-domain-containing protein n=1 Tax=Fimicolochytrium jonesii TaxID=1396493 RepID=UPI0022FE09AD|nr:peptidase family M49-domain-containing protein [Fimicolochytrium jonesii]KAI8819088.1 peptidase family M49-domain-containing protein [Fimicolochytrium jonesii]
MAPPHQYLADTDAPICRLEAKQHFETLSDKEKLYTHYLAKASWAGTPILTRTLSEHSTDLYLLFVTLFQDSKNTNVTRDISAFKSAAGVSEESWKYFVEYAVQVLYNLSNFKSFGDTKFFPRLPEAEFEKIVTAAGSSAATALFNKVRGDIYKSEPSECLLIGFPAEGHVSGYYSSKIGKSEVQAVQALLEKHEISALNTRLVNEHDKSYTLYVASAEGASSEKILKGDDGLEVKVVYGDFSKAMASIAENITKAIPYAANEHQKKMLEKYAESFRTGSIEAHRESQRHWIRDVGPIVESNIGFIETYKDPAGIRAEWEGFVAVVNKEQTEKFDHLVNSAEQFVKRLPWPTDFEVDKFIKPDFTSLEVVSFATPGGCPAGINIPNYNDIRMNEGFKNVSLGNVLSAKAPNEKITFISDEDAVLYKKYSGPAFEVQVGLHELLGHGSGKLLQEESAGKFNFDHKNPPISPLTGKPITTWYKPGETWGSVFKSTAASYEECRAEAVAMYLGVDKEIQSIFGNTDQQFEDILYVMYLHMARAGLMALEFYDPKSKKWGQAHMQARFALLNVFLKAGFTKVVPSPSGDTITIQLDRSQIKTVGYKAVGEFLQKLNVYKATADAEHGVAFYVDATSVSDEWTKYREIALANKQPRKVFVQGNTYVDEHGKAQFKDYPATLEGFIASYVERHDFRV